MSVSVVKAVSTLITVDVAESVTVTGVVTGARDSHDEQNDSPTTESAPMAPRHFGEPQVGEMQPALTMPPKKLAPRQIVCGLILPTYTRRCA